VERLRGAKVRARDKAAAAAEVAVVRGAGLAKAVKCLIYLEVEGPGGPF
jgi:hypothetical protein